MLSRNDADDVTCVRKADTRLGDDRHGGVVAGHASQDVEHDMVFVREDKVALSDVAEPHSRIGAFDARLMIWPSVEASEEPIWTIGPSRPTAAPVAMEIDDAIDLISATTGRTIPCR